MIFRRLSGTKNQVSLRVRELREWGQKAWRSPKEQAWEIFFPHKRVSYAWVDLWETIPCLALVTENIRDTWIYPMGR